MKERPILFNGPMVRAILEGRKTMTRRIVKPQPVENQKGLVNWAHKGCSIAGARPSALIQFIPCPFGQPGYRLWVKEKWDFRPWPTEENPQAVRVAYGADGYQLDAISPDGWNPMLYNTERWRPSIHMPRWASRITLEITSVRVERLQDISEVDAEAEGIDFLRSIPDADETLTARKFFECLWESINGPGSWDANPWVWVVEFKRVEVRG